MNVLGAEPDGYTLLIDGPTFSSIPAAGHKKVPFKIENRTYVARVLSSAFLHLVKADSPWKNLADVVKAIKGDPKKFIWGGTGLATLGGYVSLQVINAAGINPGLTKFVSFAGAGEYSTALAAGNIQFAGQTTDAAIPLIKAGKVRPIGTTSRKRLVQFPELPTAAEQGFPTLDAKQWVGISGPLGLPEFVVARWVELFDNLAADPQFKLIADRRGFDIEYVKGEPYRELVFEETRRMKRIYEGMYK
jgi:tripartite-type tricarboxylate transporter receptor subunit TctC